MTRIRTEWGSPDQSFVLQTYYPTWSWDDFYYAHINQTTRMMQTVQHPVSVISNMCQSGQMPTGAVMAYLYQAVTAYPTNFNQWIIVADDRYIQMLFHLFANTFAGLNRNRIHVFKTTADAFAYLPRLSTPELH